MDTLAVSEHRHFNGKDRSAAAFREVYFSLCSKKRKAHMRQVTLERQWLPSAYGAIGLLASMPGWPRTRERHDRQRRLAEFRYGYVFD